MLRKCGSLLKAEDYLIEKKQKNNKSIWDFPAETTPENKAEMLCVLMRETFFALDDISYPEINDATF